MTKAERTPLLQGRCVENYGIMAGMKRIYDSLIEFHLKSYRQMAFLSGPRQSGKTTIAKAHAEAYLNWDDDLVRLDVLAGQDRVAARCALDAIRPQPLVVAFDEIHKYRRWKQFLKGFFDDYEDRVKILATGSARMDVYRRGGDSMMGRYFPYRVHPLTVAELLDVSLPGEGVLRPPRPLDEDSWQALWTFGGFPEPFLKRNRLFSRRWNAMRREQLLREDVRDLSQIVQIDQLAALVEIISNRSGEQIVYSSLANEVRIDEKTVKNWIGVLKHLYYGFEVRPYFRNVENSIRKTPKWYLRDWSLIADEGKRFETLVACHLLKAVECWTDMGLGEFELGYLRDRQKREVDFIVTRDRTPWFLVEVKKGKERISPALAHFQKATGAEHAFQVVCDEPFMEADAFSRKEPISVPARTFLSQLV